MTAITKEFSEQFMEQWFEFSIKALSIVAPNCPSTPRYVNDEGKVVYKQRKWGPDSPRGVLFHYTGGPNGIASLRWSNENNFNKLSSWHGTILKSRLTEFDSLLTEYPLVGEYFPATALLHADWRYGTWHGNWSNRYVWGFENENLGLLTKNREGKIYRVAGRRKYFPNYSPVVVRGQYWDVFTKEQLICNINIGRICRALAGENASKAWYLPHSAVWGSKSDIGSAFPMDQIRDAIFSDEKIDDIQFLKTYVNAIDFVYEPDNEDDDLVIESRDGEPVVISGPIDFDTVEGGDWRNYLPSVRRNLHFLQYWIPNPDDDSTEGIDADLHQAISTLQRSSHCPGGPKLPVNGIPDGKTRAYIEKRLKRFGYDV